jgi:hypothetical protein
MTEQNEYSTPHSIPLQLKIMKVTASGKQNDSTTQQFLFMVEHVTDIREFSLGRIGRSKRNL